MSRIVQQSKELGLLAYPPPYQCWFALSSDPDFTALDNWQEVHTFIWEELALPFADSFFITNKNLQATEQVSLGDRPECIGAHMHDTLHTWGDFIFSGNYRFTRSDALAGIDLLLKYSIVPKVWTDHSNFIGNLLHRPHVTSTPTIKDTAGYVYENDLYTLDLVKSAGIRYIWNGNLVRAPIGQDRTLSRHRWYQESGLRFSKTTRTAISVLDNLTAGLQQFRNPTVFTYSRAANRQYYRHKFPDGTEFYCFPRFGSWQLGDIDGISKILNPETITKLIQSEGTMILYTHLGKRHGELNENRQHIPQATRDTFVQLANEHNAGRIKLSSTSKLLDYLVLRDNATVVNDEIHFRPDDIRFPSLDINDLKDHQFGLATRNRNIRVLCNDIEVSAYTLEETTSASEFKLSFG